MRKPRTDEFEKYLFEVNNQHIEPSTDKVDLNPIGNTAYGEESLAYFFNLSPALMLITDSTGKVFKINKSCWTILGYTEQEILKIGLWALVHPTDIDKTNTVIEEQLKGNRIINFTNRFISKDGSYRTLEWQASLLKDGLTYACANDITERNEAIAEHHFQCEEKEKRATELIIANKELHFQNNEKEKRADELIIANKELAFQNNEKEKRAAELVIANKELAYQNEEKEKRADELIIANKELAFQNEEKEKRAAELVIANKELDYQNRLKEKSAIELFKAKENEKRAAELIITNKELAFQNELKEKQAMELFNAKEKAEESDRLKSAFLANMSHEIRTPMNGVLGFSELLKRKNISDEKREKYLDLIDLEGRRLLNIISDIVDISTIDANLVTIKISSCNVYSLIEDLYAKYSMQSMSPDIFFKSKKGLKDTDSIIKTDSNRLTQVLSNLIENAIKFTDKGTIEFGYYLCPKGLQFYVKDSGPGIEVKDQQFIFGRFNQGEKQNTHNSGSGLGLSIAKGITELLGGEIWVESEINKGATFFVTIPYNKAPNQTNETVKSSRTDLMNRKNFTILIAEDEFIIFKHLKELLSAYSCTVIHAGNGEKAVNIAKQNPSIDIILMDINMPVMNGYQALAEIRKVNKTIPIIAQSGLAMSSDNEKMLEAGFNDCISKPISEFELTATINKHLMKNPGLNEA